MGFVSPLWIHFLVPCEFSGVGKILTSKCKDYKTTTETFKYHWIPIGYPKIRSLFHLGFIFNCWMNTQKLVYEAENSPSVCPQRYVFPRFYSPKRHEFCATCPWKIQEISCWTGKFLHPFTLRSKQMANFLMNQ